MPIGSDGSCNLRGSFMWMSLLLVNGFGTTCLPRLVSYISKYPSAVGLRWLLRQIRIFSVTCAVCLGSGLTCCHRAFTAPNSAHLLNLRSAWFLGRYLLRGLRRPRQNMRLWRMAAQLDVDTTALRPVRWFWSMFVSPQLLRVAMAS